MSVVVEIVKLISPMVVAISAAATAFFAYKGASYAYKGLSIWREQHSGKIESDLATRLLVSIYKYRDAVNDYANPFIHPLLVPPEYAPNISEQYRPFQVRMNLEKERYEKVDSARQEIYADLLISEALWGKELQVIFLAMPVAAEQDIRSKIIDLLSSILETIGNEKLTNKKEVEQIIEQTKLDKTILEKFDEKIKKAEDYLKPKIV